MANFEHAPPSKLVDGLLAVAIDIDQLDASMGFDASTETCQVDATSSFTVGPVHLTALAWWDSFDPELRLPRAEAFHVAFGHAPDYALGEVEADLLIAGHTHGGQVRLPFIGPIITFSEVPRAWTSGATELSGGRTLIVSRGIGMERGDAPRIRFLCRPEVAIIDVVPKGPE